MSSTSQDVVGFVICNYQDETQLSRPQCSRRSPRCPAEFRILSGTSRIQRRRPSVTLSTDECTGDQQPIENNNIAAVKSNNGGNASHVIQFGFVCSPANTIKARIQKLLQDSTTIKDEEESPEDALKVHICDL